MDSSSSNPKKKKKKKIRKKKNESTTRLYVYIGFFTIRVNYSNQRGGGVGGSRVRGKRMV